MDYLLHAYSTISFIKHGYKVGFYHYIYMRITSAILMHTNLFLSFLQHFNIAIVNLFISIYHNFYMILVLSQFE